MRAITSIGLGAALGIATAFPVSALAWVSTNGQIYRLLGFSEPVASALLDTALTGWPQVWDRMEPHGVSGAGALLTVSALMFGAMACLLWVLNAWIELDPGALAWRSLQWTARNVFGGRLAFLFLAWSFVALSFWLSLRWIGGSLDSWLPPLMLWIAGGLLLPWQLHQRHVIAGRWLAAWWRPRSIDMRRHLAALIVMGAVCSVLALIPGVGGILSLAVGSACASHLLLRAKPEVSWKQWRSLLKPIRWSRWLLSLLWILALCLPVLGIVVAASLFNLFGAPVAIDAVNRLGGNMPVWWGPYSALSIGIADHWWIAAILFGYPTLLAQNARLAWAELESSNGTQTLSSP